MPKRSGWQGPVPPAIVRCSDHWITQRFKKLCVEASDVLYLPKGEHRKKKEAELNLRLKELIQQAEYKNEQEGT